MNTPSREIGHAVRHRQPAGWHIWPTAWSSVHPVATIGFGVKDPVTTCTGRRFVIAFGVAIRIDFEGGYGPVSDGISH